MKMGLGGLLRNRMVLYVVLFLALVSLLNYLNARNYRSLLIFLVVALLVNCFNKNMTLVLGSALVLTHLLTPRHSVFGYGSLLEGLDAEKKVADGKGVNDKDMNDKKKEKKA
jgi:hypothetical protein